MKKFILLLFFLPAIFTSCEPESVRVHLKLTSPAQVEVPAEGGYIEVSFLLENGEYPNRIKSDADVTWILREKTFAQIEPLGVVGNYTYQILENDGRARKGVIKIIYEGQLVEVIVSQLGNVPDEEY